jgi:hypothetical protein
MAVAAEPLLPRMVDIEPGIGLGGRALRNGNEAFRMPKTIRKTLTKTKGDLPQRLPSPYLPGGRLRLL